MIIACKCSENSFTLLVLFAIAHLPYFSKGFLVHYKTLSSGSSIGFPAHEAATTVADDLGIKNITVVLRKPIGIVLEEIDETNPTAGVMVKEIDPNGSAAAATVAATTITTDTERSQLANNADMVVCIRDIILGVNGVSCYGLTFDEVMDMIIRVPEARDIELEFGRLDKSTVIRWPNGVCVAAQPGERLGAIAQLAKVRIPYSCRSGTCGTCEASISRIMDGKEKRVRPCVALVPRSATIAVNPSDRYKY